MKTKPRWDQPELMPLRYDYQLLKDCYRANLDAEARRPILSFAAFCLGLALWIVGLVALACLVQP